MFVNGTTLNSITSFSENNNLTFQRKATTSKKFKKGAVSNVSHFSLQGSGVGGKVGVIRKKG